MQELLRGSLRRYMYDARGFGSDMQATPTLHCVFARTEFVSLTSLHKKHKYFAEDHLMPRAFTATER